MINYPDQEQDRLRIASVPDDVLFFGENAGKLDAIKEILNQILFATRRAEFPNPAWYILANGRDAAFSPQTTVRTRTTNLIIGNVSLGTIPIGIQVGSNVIPVCALANGQSFSFPFPIIVDAGLGFTLWNLTANAQIDGTKCVGILFGYPELQAAQ